MHRAGWTVVTLAFLVPSRAEAHPDEPIAPPSSSEIARASPPPPPWLELEVGLDMGRFEWRLSGVQAGAELRGYTLPLIEALRIRAGLYPLRSATGLFQRLGLELWGVGVFPASLQGPPENTDFPVGQYELGAVVRLGLRVAPWLIVAPAGGISTFHSQVQPGRSGEVPVGFPTVDLLTARAGVALEGLWAPVAVRLEATALFLLPHGPLFEPPNFPSARGTFSGEAIFRIGVTLGEPLVLALELRFTQIGMDLQDPRASTASARTFFGGLSLRYSG